MITLTKPIDPDSWPDRVAALPLSLAVNRLRGDEVELED